MDKRQLSILRELLFTPAQAAQVVAPRPIKAQWVSSLAERYSAKRSFEPTMIGDQPKKVRHFTLDQLLLLAVVYDLHDQYAYEYTYASYVADALARVKDQDAEARAERNDGFVELIALRGMDITLLVPPTGKKAGRSAWFTTAPIVYGNRAEFLGRLYMTMTSFTSPNLYKPDEGFTAPGSFFFYTPSPMLRDVLERVKAHFG